jgi:ubiquinone/menaquinone biosynthesis C-methylase UbiE
MRLSKRVLQSLDADRVRRINEIYHNLENADYNQQHEDISKFERGFWQRAARKYIPQGRPVTWLDYGTGTGFVPRIIAESLGDRDNLICCDVSSEMLELCERELGSRSLRCACSFRKIDGTAIPVEAGAVDILSVNSVLHHMFDLEGFARECARVLKPSGVLIVAHEPNADVGLPVPGRLLRGLAKIVCRPQTVMFRVAEWSPLAEALLRWITSRVSPTYRRRNRMLAAVAKQIRDENLLDFDLRGTEIQQVVDFQSQEGFERGNLLERVFRGLDPIEFQTYGHLGFFPEGRMARAIDKCLAGRWPDAGREICFVLRLAPRTGGA